MNLEIKLDRVKDPAGRRIFLPNEGFKGILAVPSGARGGDFRQGMGRGGLSAGRKFAYFVPGYSSAI
jgi:hypothetical protein